MLDKPTAFPIGAKRALPLKRTASPSADDGAPVKGLSEAALYWCTVICSLEKQSDRDRSPKGRDLCSKARFTRARPAQRDRPKSVQKYNHTSPAFTRLDNNALISHTPHKDITDC